MQEETTALGVPCITTRENTERPVTVAEGSNVLVGSDPARIVAEARKVLRGAGKPGRRPHLWDGKAAQRIVEVLAGELGRKQRVDLPCFARDEDSQHNATGNRGHHDFRSR